MLGFEKDRSPIKGKYAEELLAILERMRTGNYNDADLERFHDEQVTPEWEIINEDDPNAISNFCDVCDLHRKNLCNGARHYCEKFTNEYDNETCKHCKFAEPVEGDERHVFCPKKNEVKHFSRWCNKMERK